MRHSENQRQSGRFGRPRRRAPKGAVVLELILMFPIWLIFLLAIIEFGQILSNQQQVALASRVGAEEASQTAMLPLSDGHPIPENVLQAINGQLSISGISPCRVILEHNVVPSPPSAYPTPVTLSWGSCNCDPPPDALPLLRHSIRLTVCVPLSDLTPDLLGMFGFDISNRTLQHTTTFRYEL